jgi:hypothetical protein
VANPLLRLTEGFTADVVTGIRQFFARSPEVKADELQRGGASGAERAGLPFNLVSQFGYDSLANHLRIDQDLQARYTDYEEMDEYPEISCLVGSSLVFTLEWGWKRIDELAAQEGQFHVLSYDRRRRSLVPVKAERAVQSAPEGHQKPMVRVTLDSGVQITCTADHPFLTKEGTWVEAGNLESRVRLMPGVLRMRQLNEVDSGVYWQVHQPHSDSEIRSTDGKRWVWLHRLVAEEVLGVESGSYQVVHHEDADTLNNAPTNLSVESRSSHAVQHIAHLDNSEYFPEWTKERRAAQAERMRGNTFSRGNKLSDETKRRMSLAGRGRRKNAEWRHKIGMSQPTRLDITREALEAALGTGGNIAQAAKILGVSWSVAKRRAVEYDLLSRDNNHRVMKIERLDERPAVYDLTVPGYHNFVCHGVVVHNTAYDIYADDSAMPNMERGESLWVVSENKTVENDLNDMLQKQIQVEEDIWGLDRTLSKYGNAFGEVLVSEQGLVGINYLPPPTMRRVEGPQGQLLGFVQDVRGEFNLSIEDFYKLAAQRGSGADQQRPPGVLTVFEDWEVIHWRLRGKHLRSVYGHGVADPARWIWKRLCLLEDAILIYKLSRAPARYAFYIDIGEYDNERGLAYVNRVKNQFVKKKFINPNTGKMDMRHNPLAHDEDFFIPSRGGKDSTRIEVLQGPDYSETETVEYHRDKLVSALKVPKTYMGYGGESSRAALSSEDIRFARTVMRIQRETRTGYRKACRIHLVAKGADVDRYDYDVKMSVPSAILELANIEVMSATADLATRTGEILSTKWVLTTLFKYSDEEAEELIKEKDKDSLRKAKIEAQSQKMLMQAQAAVVPPAGEEGAEAGAGGAEGGAEAGAEAGAGESRLSGKDLVLLEKRIEKVLKRHQEQVERAYERKTRLKRRADSRVAEAIKGDPDLGRRLRNIQGLLQEFKASSRPVA